MTQAKSWLLQLIHRLEYLMDPISSANSKVGMLIPVTNYVLRVLQLWPDFIILYIYAQRPVSTGVRNSAGLVPATFTSDGKHIVSVTEDSNVCIWNYNDEEQTASRAKTVRSYESFYSHNASVVVPWCGLKTHSGSQPGSILANGAEYNDEKSLSTSSSTDCFSLSRGFSFDSQFKGSATWPEEKLPNLTPLPVSPSSVSKSDYKFLKNAWQSALASSPNLWGLVVVTAGLDGYIRTFLNYGLPIRFWDHNIIIIHLAEAPLQFWASFWLPCHAMHVMKQLQKQQLWRGAAVSSIIFSCKDSSAQRLYRLWFVVVYAVNRFVSWMRQVSNFCTKFRESSYAT